MSVALIGLVGTIAVALISVASTYFLKRRDEARVGGAAERRFRAELRDALDILELSDGTPNPAWVDLAAPVEVWSTGWKQFAARLDPATWDDIDSALGSLAALRSQAIPPDLHVRSPDEPQAVSALTLQPVDADAYADTTAALKAVIALLDRRALRWLALRPWLPTPEGLSSRGRLRAFCFRLLQGLALAALLGAAALAVVSAADAIRDHVDASRIDRDTVAHEIQELEPTARVINCRGDSGADHYRCVAVSTTCAVAAVAPSACPRGAQEDIFDVTGDERSNCIYAQLARRKAARALHAAVKKRGARKMIGAVACLGRADHPVRFPDPAPA